MPKDAKTEKYLKQGNYIAAYMHERKVGILHSGSDTGPKVKSKAQALAIAFSEQQAHSKKKSGQDSAVLGTTHQRPGGHAGHGMGCPCPYCKDGRLT